LHTWIVRRATLTAQVAVHIFRLIRRFCPVLLLRHVPQCAEHAEAPLVLQTCNRQHSHDLGVEGRSGPSTPREGARGEPRTSDRFVCLSDAENGRGVHDHLQRCVGVARHGRVVEPSGRPLIVCHGFRPGQVDDVVVKRGVICRTSFAWSNGRARAGIPRFPLPVRSGICKWGGRTSRGRAGLDGRGRLDSDRGRGTSLSFSLGVVVVVVMRLRSRWRLVVSISPILGETDAG
jgi:hypothetical protein